MANKDAHISSEDLILAADGELSERRAGEIQAHLSSCWTCRGRSKDLENAITGFGRAYHDELDPQLPSAAGPRALLKARLSRLAAEQQHATAWERLTQFAFVRRRAAYVLGTFVLALAGLMLWPSSQTSLAWSPDPELTPGVILPVTEADVCGKQAARARAVMASVGMKVFEQYGIRNPQPRHYEMDYLIDPDLGGADDARNLWPQPYSTLWNANVKDALEDHLRDLVCMNQITLAQAQRDISADWISAYKTYFRTDRPLSTHQAFRKDQPWE